jgi:predicted acetyltransferase/ribosomal protein S18 acetylase RimI-like enzyme
MMIQLISPTAERRDAFRAMLDDFQRAGETEWCEKNKDAVSDFSAFVDRLENEAKGITVAGWVPTSHYWLIQSRQIIGTLRMRHYLTPVVKENTGHVGYDIAPSFRRKGHGYEILRLGLLEAEKLGIGDVLAHCADSNVASLKIIQKHGGVPERSKRCETWYWIKRKTPHPVVREARLQDAEAIARVHVASWQSAYRGIMPEAMLDQLSVAKWTKDWKVRLQPSERLTFVLEVDGAIQGWASIGPCRDDDKETNSGEIYGIYLNPSCWSKGQGAMLYLRTETAMRASSFTESRLWVLEANDRARRFYEKAGYEHDGHTKCMQREGAELFEIRYKKSL